MAHVYIPNPVAQSVIDRLRVGNEVTLGYGDGAATWEQVADTVEATLVRGDMITAERIQAAPNLKVIARHGVGTNNVDLDAAAARGIWVTTTPGANAQAVAEHVFALLLTLTRHTATAAQRVRAGRWNDGRTDLVGVQLSGKTLLLIGGGGIARLVIPVARGFGMTVIVYDPFLSADDAVDLRVDLVQLEEGLAEADVVSIHVPLTPATEDLLDARRLSLMKRGAYVINTSRGGVIDEAALTAGIQSGHIAGAGLDVIEAEGVDMMEPLQHSNIDLSVPNLLVTPHIGGQTQDSLHAVGMLAAESVEVALTGQCPPRALDLPVPSNGV